MKTFLDPYLVVTRSSWVGISITSYSVETEYCRVIVCNSHGETVFNKLVRLPSYKIVTLSSNSMGLADGRYCAYLSYRRGITHRVIQGNRSSVSFSTSVEVDNPPVSSSV